MLYAIAIFMSSVFNVPMPIMIILLGTIITLMTVLGGSWSATAGDFVQMLVVVIITVIMSALTLIKVGGEYDLRLISVDGESAMPAEGERLVIVGKHDTGDILHFRIFNAGGIEVVNKSETDFADKGAELQDLKQALEEYWGQTPVPSKQKDVILQLVTPITGHTMGGFRAFIDRILPHHRDWTLFARPEVLLIFIITLLINQLIQMNSLLEGAARFIFVKDARSAKKAVLIQTAGLFILPLIWIVPPMMAAVWHPNIAEEFPKLNNASEAAYVAMAIDLLPAGLFGLLVCGIFAATVTSLNSQLNVVGGSFVRNVYIQVIRPHASEREQIGVGRMFMLLYGTIWILLGLCFQQVKDLELFDLLLLIAAATTLPLTVPLFLGIFIKKTPPWAGWSTMVAGFVPAAILGLLFKVEPFVKWLGKWLWQNPEMTTDDVVRMIWRTADLNSREVGDLKIAITTGVVAAVCTGWFLLTMLFYRKKEQPYVEQVDNFFADMATPVQADELELGDHDNESRQCAVLAKLCLVYGAFILLMVLIPNELAGRLIICCCGVIIAGIGLVLRALGRRVQE
jgi:Na+/proline symporter